MNEATMFKIIVDGEGAMFSITMKKRAYFFFLSNQFVGARVAPTTDPDLGIVELSGYSIHKILKNWERLHLVMLPRNPSRR
ncbi:MAG: hypothetical protein OK422_04630 [Thaumarchaeota archaeon]|nr:hypothetical protein [Nitrososphaerota archaeon]